MILTRRALTILFAAFAAVAFILGCGQRTNAGESRKAVTVMFTNDVLGEYAPCG